MKFSMMASMATLLIMTQMGATFVLDEITMDEETFAACSTCDDRAAFAFSLAASKALREFMSRNPVKMAIEKGDVVARSHLPNEGIHTGHSCSITAEARDINVEAKMVNDKDYLNNMEIEYVDEIYTTFLGGEVPHKVDVSLNIRMWFGQMVLGNCHNLGRKTCPANAYSTGTNMISVSLEASDIIPFTDAAGKQHLRFNLNTGVFSDPDSSKYSPTRVDSHGCEVVPGVGIDKYVEKYAGRYINTQNYKPEISAKLVKRLEEVLQAEMDGQVIIPVNVMAKDGSRKITRIDGCGEKKKCPDGFSRIGNTQMCQRQFGFDKPNCSDYADDAVLHSKTVGGRQIYWCEAPMIPDNSV